MRDRHNFKCKRSEPWCIAARTLLSCSIKGIFLWSFRVKLAVFHFGGTQMYLGERVPFTVYDYIILCCICYPSLPNRSSRVDWSQLYLVPSHFPSHHHHHHQFHFLPILFRWVIGPCLVASSWRFTVIFQQFSPPPQFTFILSYLVLGCLTIYWWIHAISTKWATKTIHFLFSVCPLWLLKRFALTLHS